MRGRRQGRRARWVSAGLALSVLTVGALTASAPPAGAQVIVKRYATEYDVKLDGSYVETVRQEIEPTNSAAAHDVGQRTVTYSSSLQDLDVTEAYNLKADGRKLPVEPSAIFAQLPQGAPNLPMFNDFRQKTIVFPDVEAGDTVVYVYKLHMKQPHFPGQFLTWSIFPRTVAFKEATATIRAPAALALRIESHQLVADKQVKGDAVTYSWRYAGGALTEDPGAISNIDRAPGYFVSSFKSYDAMAQAYAQLALSKATVTPKVAQMAAQLTAGITDRREQARKLYEWVSTQVRYVSITLGQGGIVPHDAATVLVNRYGDCKDKVVLLAALLKAKGIESEMVLINSGNSYRLSDVPTIAQLDHAILWVPEFGLYLDSTAGVAPFGSLPFDEYGKPVVHAVSTGGALRKTPVLPPEVAQLTERSTMKMQADGRSTIDTVVTASGPFAVTLRQTALAIQSNGSERTVKAQMRAFGMEGSGRYDFTAPDALAPDYKIAGHFEADPRPDYVSGAAFALEHGLWLSWAAGDLLMGPLFVERLKDTEPTPCFAGHIIEELSIELPKGKHPAKLPEAKDVRTDNLSYSAQYSIDRNVVSVRREFTARVDQPLCTGDLRKATARALAEIRADRRAQIALVSD